MGSDTVDRNSNEYAELLAEVFAEIIHKGAESKYFNRASEAEVTPALMQCLHFVYLHGRSSVRRIAQGLSISEPAGSQLVERLVQRNLVIREESREDRRQTQVDLTDAGRELVQKAVDDKRHWFRAICDRLPADRRQSLVDSLEEFIYLALDNEQDVDQACVKCGIDHLAFCVLNRAHIAAAGAPIDNY